MAVSEGFLTDRLSRPSLFHFSLFSGVAGIDLAAEWAGFETVGQVEIDNYCTRVLERHFPGVPRWRDVKDVTAESFERRTGIKPGTLAVLSGGFPCQPVSCAGKRKGDTDERWLWDEMLRVICEIRPRWVVAENVRGILSIDNNRTYGRILRDLAQNGYRVGWLCYGAGDVGAPHKRERVFIVGYAGSCGLSKRGRTCNGSEDVAYATQQLLNRPRQAGKTGRGEPTNCSDVADADIMHREQCRPSGRMGWGLGAEENAGECGSGGNAGTVESGMGMFVDGLSSQLAGHRWPAGPGEQYEWEPPRIATGVKDRVAKLKALGNAVVPAQAYPIFRAIMETERRASLSHVEVRK
jgi:DNA (cytosine-5)-methyltransferase 1